MQFHFLDMDWIQPSSFMQIQKLGWVQWNHWSEWSNASFNFQSAYLSFNFLNVSWTIHSERLSDILDARISAVIMSFMIDRYIHFHLNLIYVISVHNFFRGPIQLNSLFSLFSVVICSWFAFIICLYGFFLLILASRLYLFISLNTFLWFIVIHFSLSIIVIILYQFFCLDFKEISLISSKSFFSLSFLVLHESISFLCL